MSTDLLTLAVVTLGPILIYSTVALTLQLPELVAGWPAALRHSIEALGGLLVVLAWLTLDTVGGALAVVGLLLLAAPTIARFLSQSPEAIARQNPIHRPKIKRSTRFM